MKGSEENSHRKRSTVPQTTIGSGQAVDLSESDKQDIVFAANHYQPLYKLMELLIVKARDEAMLVDPSKEAEQRAAMTVAHAMSKFYLAIRAEVQFFVEGEHEKFKQKAAQEAIQEQETIENIVLQQTY